jgi:Alpha/beta hydrolase domain
MPTSRTDAVALDRWVRTNVEPPPSAHPQLSDKTLVPRDQIAFPAIPGVHSPLTIPAGYRADLAEPQTHALPLLVPQVDAHGNELSGIRLPNVAVPLATYTGWNFRSPAIGQPGELLPLTGSFIPFPVTKAAQEAAHDPRPSIEERYGNRERYQVLVTDAAAKLVQQRYLLNQDVPPVVERALATWDEITGGALSAQK